MNFLRRYAEQIDRQIRPVSSPLAVKLLEKEEDIPEGAQRPKMDFGTCLSTCQGFSMSGPWQPVCSSSAAVQAVVAWKRHKCLGSEPSAWKQEDKVSGHAQPCGRETSRNRE